MTTLLHPTDFSEGADRALAEAIRIARALGAEVLLLHVESPFYSEGLKGMTVADRVRVHEAERRWVEEMLEARVAGIRAAGVPARGVIQIGLPFEEIVRTAEAQGADLIVMGTQGRAGLDRMSLGSVADRVIRTAPCPVVTVRERRSPTG